MVEVTNHEFSVQSDKVAIAQAFSKAAARYDQHAAFQRDVGLRLLDKLPQQLNGWRILDLGCGTGYCSQILQSRGATVVCVDLSLAMLQQAYQRCGTARMAYLQADGEVLPFASSVFDVVFSSLALQWCENLATPLQEIYRVLKPTGRVCLSTLLEGSLVELQQSWLKVDSYQHVNRFTSLNQIKIALAQADYQQIHLDLSAITVWYESAVSLMRDLKGIGANHVPGRAQGLTRRHTLAQVEQAYQLFRNHQGLLPATYQVCLGVLHR
ncbi:malonyl-ACP O-methyltransferase BioC [Vibrio sp. V27_P1S3P104]|uniref:malonyl-ACP O-methyltransferase BioC n=1 Tax=unclassified Vibrio TaxID=2614977 RepID=UPI00137281E0|nr:MULTISPECIES: malonyl-ACP O-methyltransferase BioC [unclassified Vibrio]NAW68873.1 malonyl-ACP O-methyltransferase BioC [Vibrio sp. V28_P6S34P95]NAX04072.1 malonyl-ACP O-methyltransferase BioC [Vibrio sp. V30_P3S12P165]NAX33985.1 malonyl-ACP O-methyltransferase BioC [Vibrio sp. V29_P1S30P107]NAX36262.1 malonyl-ACP O-methyltransferase BioC [Vibrio sp. V27_P1S3P104]NAX41479.1 malonyl-ACP O-methyltransferase BioC [Vibrio sp. V26_P1S5P106]